MYSSGMKGERILVADDDRIVREGVSMLIETSGSDNHKVIGQAASVSEVEKLLKKGLRPTVALVDNKFPDRGDGEQAAKIIKELSPGTIVVSFSDDENLKWGDKNWGKIVDRSELIKRLTELEH